MIKKYIKKCEMYSMIISILMIVLSLCLIFKPVKSIETFVLLFSIIMLVNGVIGVVTYFTIDSDERLFSFDLLSGITNILAGVLVFMYRSSLVEVFPIMLGIYVIVSNLLKMQISINLLNCGIIIDGTDMIISFKKSFVCEYINGSNSLE